MNNTYQGNSDPSHEDCGCSKAISSKAEQIFRIDYSPVATENVSKIRDFKTKLAQLYTQVDDAMPYPPEDRTDIAAFDAYFVASESLYEARRHLQLASYYITHALTA